ncbi:hypothetical protein BDV34DRAFT_222353 [Aspergillus parasiticus]|uniref:BZIP domain-containing protein n=1 Tax=Aspergillus parasiticus TaxID=5067 RepID=A0A5N6DV75_ASPPA|nr:hypothetical protein BDV34DRAFT_222353 [Aspergillus parasiticus]
MSEDNHDAPTDTTNSLCLTPDSEVQSLQHDNLSAKTAKVPSRKRGRPRKALGTRMDKNKKDRRRTQVRLAQRAYRSRKEATVELLNKRVAQLEAATQKMSEAVITFSDTLLLSGALTSRPDLARHLRETVQICLSSAKDIGDEDSFNTATHDENPLLSSLTPISPGHLTLSESEGPPSLSTVQPSPCLLRYHPSSLFFFKPGDVAVMEVSDFTDQLRIACLYEGLLILDNSSVPLTTLKRPFRLLLSLFTRASITSIFRSALHARLNKRSYMSFKEVPSCLTRHAGQPSTQNQTTECQSALDQPQSISDSSLPSFNPQNLKEIGGDWFDVQELANYLQERDTRLLVRPPKNMTDSSSQSAVNARALIVALVSKAMCLGHSPGFRRSDVEQAINICTWRGAL